MNDPQLQVISDVVDSLPDVFLNIKSFYLLHVIELQFASDSSFGFQALSTDDENILFIELADTERLSWLIEVWEHNPLFTGDREELTSVQTLYEWLATRFLISVSHTSKHIEVVLVLVDNVVGSWVEHIV
jgi:hypothetical protein